MATTSIASAIKMLRALLTRSDKLKWLGVAGFSLCISALEVLTASAVVIFAQVISQPESGQKYIRMFGVNQDISPNRIVFYIAIALGIIFLVKNIVVAGEIFYQNFTIQRIGYRFKNKMLAKYSEIDYGTYLTRNSSFGIQTVDLASHIFSQGMLPIATIFSEGMVFVGLVGMMVYMNPSLALVISFIGVVFWIIVTKYMFPMFYCFGQKQMTASRYCVQHLTQFFHAFKEVVLLGKRDAFVRAYSFFSWKSVNTSAVQNSASALPRIVIELLFVGIFVTSISLLCLSQKNIHQMLGTLGGYLYAGFRLMPGINRLINQLSVVKTAIPSIEQVFSECSFLSSKENYADIPAFQFQNGIIIKDLYFKYLNTKKAALTDVSIDIRKGESVGIVGETGSGKSTLVDVMLGLLQPYKGSVLIDGKYPASSYQWHRMIGYVPQSVYLTDDTIEANIAFGEDKIDEARINRVIDIARLRKLIGRLPEGAKTIVGERGIRLSGGERQRISIARALYHNPEVLIFDEATSALDNETESKLMET
ncbi:MAG: ABC transporter ATP-binding protein/permease, partial [Holosporales bacterium]|nr:ABC transporter ATP-binding protein/permease [Holosporales bacterium]